MSVVTRFVLDHKRVVVGFWLVVAIAAFAAIGPATGSLSQQFSAPGLEASEANDKLGEIYGSGGDIAPIVPVVKLPKGTTVDSPGITKQLDAAVAKVEAALPKARTASYASTGNRAFVSDDGRTTFALVYIPAKGGVDPGWVEAQAAQKALNGVTVGGSAVEVTGLDALRSSAGESDQGAGVLRGRPLARRTPAAKRHERCRGAKRDAPRRLVRRVQRHDRGDLAACARRPANPVFAQHRHCRPAYRAGQRPRGGHPPAGPAGHDRAEARLAS
jgi:hypothetical protein